MSSVQSKSYATYLEQVIGTLNEQVDEIVEQVALLRHEVAEVEVMCN